METQDNYSDGNDGMAVVTVEPPPAVVAMAIDERIGEVTDPETSCVQSTTNSNVNGSSTPSKKAVDRELRQPFPVKVYEMLENAENKQFSHIVSWNETGTGFMVHDKDHFTKEIVPHYFNLTKYKSFQRQLSLYGFQRVTVGSNKGLRYHEKLRKGEIELVRQMKPVGYKPRNISRLLEQKRQKQQHLQQIGGGTNILTTTTTTVVKTTTTSTTSLLTNDPSKNGTNSIPTDGGSPRDITYNTVLAKSPISDVSSTTIPPVVSSNSLIKQEDHEVNNHDSKKQQLDHKQYQVHAISPETTCHNTIHLQNCAPQLNGSEAAENEIVDFEGMCFHLMSPTRELGINVKLKLLEEFNPASSLLKLASKYVTAEYTTISHSDHVTAATIPETIPITIDTVQSDSPSLLEPFTDIVSTAAATSTASTIAALQSAVANSVAYESVPTTTTIAPMEARGCMDPFNFHSINVANRISSQ
jgi:hypothetical protein